MSTLKERGFGSPLKGIHEESAGADIVLTDSSTSLGMTDAELGFRS